MCLFLYLIDLRDLFLCYLVYLFLHYILLFVYRPSVDLVKFKLTAEQTVMELNPMNMLVAQKLKSLRFHFDLVKFKLTAEQTVMELNPIW